jgi:hypothetical protein
LGQQEFGQKQGTIQAQAAAGSQQQALEQQKMSQDYQDFLTQRGYPQQQLAFMSDILRGIPLGQQTQTQYTAPASMASQLSQLGLGAYGMSKAFGAEGGQVKTFAEGGIASSGGGTSTSVPIDKIRSMLGDMSDDQLQQVAQGTKDAVTLALVSEQQKLNQRLRNSQILSEAIPQDTIKDELIARGGIDEAPIPESMFGNTAVGEQPELQELAPAQEQMAQGGIVAFAKGDKVEAKPDYIGNLAKFDPQSGLMTEAEQNAATDAGLARIEKYMGKDETVPMMQKLIESYQAAYSPAEQERQKGLWALKAAGKFGRRGKGFTEELGEAAAGLASDVADYKKAENDAKKQAALAQIDLVKAQRAEKRGNFDLAEKYSAQAAARKQTIAQLTLNKNEKLASIDMQQQQLSSQERIAREQIAATRAGQTDYNREILGKKINEFVSAFVQKNGREPNKQERAALEGMAADASAKILKVDPYGSLRAGATAANVLQDEMTNIDKQLSGHALGIPLPSGDTVESLRARRAELQRRYDSALRGEQGGAQPAANPAASGRVVGQIYTDRQGNRAKYKGGDPNDPNSYEPA